MSALLLALRPAWLIIALIVLTLLAVWSETEGESR